MTSCKIDVRSMHRYEGDCEGGSWIRTCSVLAFACRNSTSFYCCVFDWSCIAEWSHINEAGNVFRQ